jgi:hypothetical protein
MITTNKRYSYPRVAVIQIDVHPGGENPINTPHAFHAWFAYGPGPYISRGLHRQPCASPHKDETCPYTWDKSWRPKTDWPGRCLGSPHSPLPHDRLRVGERDFSQVVTQLHQFTGPITPACDRYVQYLLARANSLVLNWHRRGLQPWRCRLSTHHSPTFPTDSPPLSI